MGNSSFFSDAHWEDEQYTKLLQQFPFNAEVAKKQLQHEKAEDSAIGTTPQVSTKDIPNDPNFIPHIIKEGDTLVGLALKYGVTVDILEFRFPYSELGIGVTKNQQTSLP